MDLSKAFDIIKHDLLLAKFHAYDFSKKALKIIHNYLRNRWHKTKINKDFSTWQELLHGAPQGCVLGPLLFNMCLNDLLFVIESTELCNFAHDTTNRLKHNSFLAIEWFENNSMRLNDDQCHLLISGHNMKICGHKLAMLKFEKAKHRNY